jgi:CheY-like chemotaxis protein
LTSVLFVDDEPNVLSGVRRILRPLRSELEASFAPGGREAIEILSEQSFDIVVSDIRMPMVDGSVVLSYTKARHPESIRVILSGTSERRSLVRSLLIAHQLLSKPVDATELMTRMLSLSALSQSLPDLALRRALGGLDGLPASPATVARLLRARTCAEPSADELEAVMTHDVGMTGKLLQLLAALVSSQASPDMRAAMASLDADSRRELVVALGGLTMPAGERASFTRALTQAVTDHSNDLAERLERCSPAIPIGPAVGARLRGIGLLVLAATFPEELTSVIGGVQLRGGDILEIERQVLGTDHLAVGRYLAILWAFPRVVTDTISLRPNGAEVSEILEQSTIDMLLRCGALDESYVSGVHLDRDPLRVPSGIQGETEQ